MSFDFSLRYFLMLSFLSLDIGGVVGSSISLTLLEVVNGIFYLLSLIVSLSGFLIFDEGFVTSELYLLC